MQHTSGNKAGNVLHRGNQHNTHRNEVCALSGTHALHALHHMHRSMQCCLDHGGKTQHSMQRKIKRHNAVKTHTSISHVVTSESWLMVSGMPHRNEKMTCRDKSVAQPAHSRHMVSRRALHVDLRIACDIHTSQHGAHLKDAQWQALCKANKHRRIGRLNCSFCLRKPAHIVWIQCQGWWLHLPSFDPGNFFLPGVNTNRGESTLCRTTH